DRSRAILAALIGGAVGFCAPALLQIVSVLDKWIESDEIGWLAERIHKNGSPDEDLMRVLLEALARRPVPPLLYRTDVHDGSRVIVGLGSAYRDAEEQGERKDAATWLFGGRSAEVEGGTSRHGCPARDAALSTVLGVIKALLEQTQIKRENRLVISYVPAKQTTPPTR
ncbi:MAG TPA: hypothetical protein VMF89_26385, partial [Polyangiales bacterium]|nr:hypothetical protein [Polyangiales bacterium]